jgi:hypothetical protein
MNIKIKDTSYKIIFVDNNHEEIVDCFGKTCLYSKNIWIDKNYINHRETLIHEITHAFIFEYGFENVKWNEEMVCLFTSKYLDKILRLIK